MTLVIKTTKVGNNLSYTMMQIADEYTRMKRSRFSSPKPKRLTTQVKHMQRDNLKKLFVAYGLTEDKVSYDQSTSSRTRSCVEDVRRARD